MYIINVLSNGNIKIFNRMKFTYIVYKLYNIYILQILKNIDDIKIEINFSQIFEIYKDQCSGEA